MENGGTEEAGEWGDQEDDWDGGADGSSGQNFGGAGKLIPLNCEVICVATVMGIL